MRFTEAIDQFCRRQQEELERRMKAMDKEDLEFEEQVGSLKEQAEQYTKKLKKLYASYQTKKSEREGLRKEFQVSALEFVCGWRTQLMRLGVHQKLKQKNQEQDRQIPAASCKQTFEWFGKSEP